MTQRKTTRKGTEKQITRIALILDRSGSMQSIVKGARDGLDEQLGAIKANVNKKDSTYLTLMSFDHEIVTHFDRVNINKLPNINAAEIINPRGSTALNDAVMQAIKLLKEPRTNKNTAYLVILISDGEENASETPSSELAKEIKKLEDSGKWTFTFMLSNVDIRKVRDRLGLSAGNVAAYNYSNAGYRGATVQLCSATADFLVARTRGVTQTKTFYNGGNDTPVPDEIDDKIKTAITPTTVKTVLTVTNN